MSALPNHRDIMISEIRLLLGDGMVDVELDPDHYHLAISLAEEKLRQRSDGALEEEDIFITTQADVQEYKLPDEVQEVRRLYRRGVGAHTSGGANFDPVDAAFYNIYLLQPNRSGGLSTWDFYNQYLETVERVFASQYNFVWYNSRKTLRLIRRPTAQEDVAVRVWTQKSEDALLTDPYTKYWIRSWALAMCKNMLGQARNKYPSGYPGPQGAVTLNGDQLIQEAQQEMEKLEQDIDNMVPASDGYGFIIG